jgi:hypothetical protein
MESSFRDISDDDDDDEDTDSNTSDDNDGTDSDGDVFASENIIGGKVEAKRLGEIRRLIAGYNDIIAKKTEEENNAKSTEEKRQIRNSAAEPRGEMRKLLKEAQKLDPESKVSQNIASSEQPQTRSKTTTPRSRLRVAKGAGVPSQRAPTVSAKRAPKVPVKKAPKPAPQVPAESTPQVPPPTGATQRAFLSLQLPPVPQQPTLFTPPPSISVVPVPPPPSPPQSTSLSVSSSDSKRTAPPPPPPPRPIVVPPRASVGSNSESKEIRTLLSSVAQKSTAPTVDLRDRITYDTSAWLSFVKSAFDSLNTGNTYIRMPEVVFLPDRTMQTTVEGMFDREDSMYAFVFAQNRGIGDDIPQIERILFFMAYSPEPSLQLHRSRIIADNYKYNATAEAMRIVDHYVDSALSSLRYVRQDGVLFQNRLEAGQRATDYITALNHAVDNYNAINTLLGRYQDATTPEVGKELKNAFQTWKASSTKQNGLNYHDLVIMYSLLSKYDSFVPDDTTATRYKDWITKQLKANKTTSPATSLFSLEARTDRFNPTQQHMIKWLKVSSLRKPTFNVSTEAHLADVFLGLFLSTPIDTDDRPERKVAVLPRDVLECTKFMSVDYYGMSLEQSIDGKENAYVPISIDKDLDNIMCQMYVITRKHFALRDDYKKLTGLINNLQTLGFDWVQIGGPMINMEERGDKSLAGISGHADFRLTIGDLPKDVSLTQMNSRFIEFLLRSVVHKLGLQDTIHVTRATKTNGIITMGLLGEYSSALVYEIKKSKQLPRWIFIPYKDKHGMWCMGVIDPNYGKQIWYPTTSRRFDSDTKLHTEMQSVLDKVTVQLASKQTLVTFQTYRGSESNSCSLDLLKLFIQTIKPDMTIPSTQYGMYMFVMKHVLFWKHDSLLTRASLDDDRSDLVLETANLWQRFIPPGMTVEKISENRERLSAYLKLIASVCPYLPIGKEMMLCEMSLIKSGYELDAHNLYQTLDAYAANDGAVICIPPWDLDAMKNASHESIRQYFLNLSPEEKLTPGVVFVSPFYDEYTNVLAIMVEKEQKVTFHVFTEQKNVEDAKRTTKKDMKTIEIINEVFDTLFEKTTRTADVKTENPFTAIGIVKVLSNKNISGDDVLRAPLEIRYTSRVVFPVV